MKIAEKVNSIAALVSGWFSPAQPLPAIAPAGTPVRQFNYQVSQNLQINPRAGLIDFEYLRMTSEKTELIRLAIETRKNQIMRMNWAVRMKDGVKSRAAVAMRDSLTRVLMNPSNELTWDGWVRMLLEDMLVIDAATVMPIRAIDGGLIGLMPVDGSTIAPRIGIDGRPYEYQQIIKGMPAVTLELGEIYYVPRNPRTHRIYGYSPVEQIILTAATAQNRAEMQFNEFAEGNTPSGIITMPETFTPSDIERVQTNLDSRAGDLARRRRQIVLPAGSGYIKTAADPLLDSFDEWLAKVICFAFDISPQQLIKQQNRATAEASDAMAKEEGLLSSQRFIKSIIDRVIRDFYDPDLIEFTWAQEEQIDPLKQAQIHAIYLQAGVITPEYVAQKIGVPAEFIQTKKQADNPIQIEKAAGGMKKIDRERGEVLEARAAFSSVITNYLDTVRANSVKKYQQLQDAAKGVAKKDGETELDRILRELTESGDDDVARAVQASLEAIFKSGANLASEQVGAGELRIIDPVALDFAQNKGAALVGMQVRNGVVVRNPNPAYSIAQTTRDGIKSELTKALEGGLSNEEFAANLQKSYAFSKQRALAIATTELAAADMAGSMFAYRAAGVIKKRWLFSNSEGVCPACQGNAAQGAIGMDDDFQSGDDAPPAHPSCRCDVSPIIA